MNKLKNKYLLAILCGNLLLGILGCGGNFKLTEAKFNREPTEVINDLKRLDDFQNADIRWTTSSSGEGITNNLKVYLINGQKLSENDSTRQILGKKAMSLVLSSIENDTVYNKFIVYFISQKKTGIVTIKNQFPYSYNLNDFKKL